MTIGVKEIYAFKDIHNYDSSSGGAFPAIIRAVGLIERCNPIVYGAAFDENFNVKHIRTSCEEEYISLRGSKYVQSKLGNIYDSVCSDLIDGKVVIFSGTPCQMEGLNKKILKDGVDNSRLYLVDIVCHGTPKPIVWNDFKEWLEQRENSRLVEFSFRYSKAKWKSYPVMARFENEKRYINSFKLRRYTELFYSDLILNSGCYKCPFANINRNSDITIGDFWGIRKVIPEFPYKEEVSQVLVNTQKGKKLIEIMKNFEKCNVVEAELEKAIIYQMCFNHPTRKPDLYEEFWNDYSSMDFQNILKKYGGYNFRGAIKHLLKKFLGETGILILLKNIIKR